MDDLDRAIIAQLSQDGRMSVAVLARRVKVARSTVQARLERLETTGAIAGYTVRLGDNARQARIRATCLLAVEAKAQPALLGRLRAMPAVERVNSTSGRVDLLVQLACGSTSELDDVLDQIGNLSGVKSSESLIHLSIKFERGG
ncbi:MAG: AsnC family transcriptional regulator [Paracoccus denitrificans]|nr:MAG: AsnC family transcriptional regulator [Paracoccus denitrificans]PZO85347.1 MAG: AsnC family transcriptional regulator [Paracoccus denitrificans]